LEANARTVENAKDIVPDSRYNGSLKFIHPARKSLGLISRIYLLILICRKLIQDFLNAPSPF